MMKHSFTDNTDYCVVPNKEKSNMELLLPVAFAICNAQHPAPRMHLQIVGFNACSTLDEMASETLNCYSLTV